MRSYYDDKLSAERLQRCYELAPPRVQQYLAAELQHVLNFIRPGDRVLELGCGYGRMLEHLASRVGLAGEVTGIDTSAVSLALATDWSRAQGPSSEAPPSARSAVHAS